MPATELQNLVVANRAEQTKVFGLLWIRSSFVSEDVAPVRVHVSVDEENAAFSFEQCLTSDQAGRYNLRFNILTHLLRNGVAMLKVKVELENREFVAFQDKLLVISNDTPLAASVTDDLKRYGASALMPRYVDSAMFPYQDGGTRAWFDADQPEDVPLTFDQAADMEAAHLHLKRWGFCILPERLPQELIDGFKKDLTDAINEGRIAHQQGSSQRIHNAHKLEGGRKIWLYRPVMDFLKNHFRDTPCACQTLTYINGSEQDAHQDTIHLTPYPAGYMCGVWIALEDVEAGSGELVVYPGSHKAPRLRAGELGLEKVDKDYSSYVKFDQEIKRIVTEGGFDRMEYLPKAGQILVWHENLVHGGAKRVNREKTRMSIVSHYFAKGSVAYYDSRGEAAALEILPELA